jgi:SAM-dependent methyltransferase
VVGVDVDPVMLDTARRLAPGLDWHLGDLATVGLEANAFDVAVLAGNVLLFVLPGSEGAVLANVAAAVRPGGHVIAGFSLRAGGYDLDRIDADATAAGLELDERFATWDRDRYAGGDYAVSVFRRRPRVLGPSPA